MPFRFFRRKTLIPGVRLNLSRSLPSLSFGPRGFHYTVGPGRHRTTIGLPGTGVFYTAYSHRQARRRSAPRARSVQGPPDRPTPGADIVALFHKPPAAKIGYGLLLTILVLTAPIGLPLLITGIVQLFLPHSRARGYIAKAERSDAAAARQLLDHAAQLHPDSTELIAANAQWAYDQHDHERAAELFADYLQRRPDDWVARGHWAQALLDAGRWDDAIAALQTMRTAPVTDDSAATITAHLALAFLHKNDAQQALEIVKTAPLQRRTLGVGLQQCLFVRGLCQYLVGHHARGIADLDRLYAMDPTFDGLAEAKSAMQSGSYVFAPPQTA